MLLLRSHFLSLIVSQPFVCAGRSCPGSQEEHRNNQVFRRSGLAGSLSHPHTPLLPGCPAPELQTKATALGTTAAAPEPGLCRSLGSAGWQRGSGSAGRAQGRGVWPPRRDLGAQGARMPHPRDHLSRISRGSAVPAVLSPPRSCLQRSLCPSPSFLTRGEGLAPFNPGVQPPRGTVCATHTRGRGSSSSRTRRVFR